LKQYELEIFADYFQVYIADKSATDALYEDMDWTPQALADRFIAGNGFVAIAAARNMTVPVVLIIGKDPLDPSVYAAFFDEADHVIEGDLKLSTGQLLVWGPGGYVYDSFRLNLDSGRYQIRIYFNQLDSLSEDGLAGDDLYKIVLFPASKESSTSYRVTKQFE
jgi:hypothetical protein